MLVPFTPPLAWFKTAKRLLGADPVEARTIWSAMLKEAGAPDAILSLSTPVVGGISKT